MLSRGLAGLAIAASLLLGASPARAQERLPYETPEVPVSIRIHPEAVQEWLRGHYDGWDNDRPIDEVTGSPVYVSGYRIAYFAAKQVRERARHREIRTRYGPGALEVWNRGHVSGLNDAEADPPKEIGSSFYMAYMDGRLKGQQERARTEAASSAAAEPRASTPGELQRMSRWEKVDILSRQYIGHVNAMNLYSALLANLAEAGEADMQELLRPRPKIADTLAAVDAARDRAQRMLTAYTKFNEHAWAAQQLKPLVVEALDAVTKHDLDPSISSQKFEHYKAVLYMGTTDLKDIADSLRNATVMVPEKFPEMGERLHEWIPVLDRIRKVTSLRQTLATEDFSQKALAVACEEHQKFTTSWVKVHLREWQQTQLDRLYTSHFGPSADIKEEVRRLGGAYVDRPREARDSEERPEVVMASYAEDAGADATPPKQEAAPEARPPVVQTRRAEPLAVFISGVAGISGLLLLAYIAKVLYERRSARAR